MTTDPQKLSTQICALMTLHRQIAPGGKFSLTHETQAMNAVAAAEIAGVLADVLVSLADSPSTRELRAQVLSLTADRRRSAGLRELHVLNTVGWLKQRFHDRREWLFNDLWSAAIHDGIDPDTLFDAEVKALPIKRKRNVNATGRANWLWVTAASWPPGHIRPRTRRARKRLASGAGTL
jgi:hypothetical protein